MSQTFFSQHSLRLMKRESRQFARNFNEQLDLLLSRLPQEDQHELLDHLAGELEARMDALLEGAEP